MLNLKEIKQTKVYQDAKSEGKTEGIEQGIQQGIRQGKLEQKIAMISLLQELGLTVEQIAQRLEIEESLVRANFK
jgi:predicted transposase/invertase (TIGR01784 family)